MDEPGDPRSRLLRQVWAQVRSSNEVNILNYPSARRAVEAGAAPSDLVKAMTAAAYETAFRLLFLISAEHAEEGAPDARTGWALTEADIDPSGSATPNLHQSLDFLHEDLLMADPTGLEARDLFS
jgi:hypothetical protein